MSDNVSAEEAKPKIAVQITKNSKDSRDVPGSQVKPPVKKSDEIGQMLKYTRYATDLESLKSAYHAAPYVSKFFWMIYRLSPIRTSIITAVFILQGLLPALRLRTGGDFIQQVAAKLDFR